MLNTCSRITRMTRKPAVLNRVFRFISQLSVVDQALMAPLVTVAGGNAGAVCADDYK